jgi:uncharacterized protein YqgC (DUF456 family)
MNTFWIVITILIMCAGLAGTVLPFLPGIPLIYGCIIAYGLLSGWKAYGAGAAIGWGVVTLIMALLDFYAGSIGARCYGASRAGVWGSILGGIVGTIIAGLPGLIIGPFVGAVGGELLSGRSGAEALRSGWGAIVGFIGGGIVKVAVAISMIGSFLWWVLI